MDDDEPNFAGLSSPVFSLVRISSTPGTARASSRSRRTILAQRGNRTEAMIDALQKVGANSSGIGTPDDMRKHLETFQDSGVDQVIFLQQAGRNRHDHICESLELFAAEVMPAFKAQAAAREARKAEELAPYIAAALKRKAWMKPLADDEIPVVKAAVDRAQFGRGSA